MPTSPGHPDGYLLYHSIGLFPGQRDSVGAALARYADAWCAADDGQWGMALGQRASFIDLWRAQIGAQAGSLTAAENVTGALYSLIGALPDARLRGRIVLVAADCFPSLHFLLSGLQERRGFRLETVPLRPGASYVEDDDVVARWTPEVALALLTWVTSTASKRCDLARLVEHGRRMGSMIGVDITQAVGVVPFDVGAPAIDFAVSTSLKWLCGMAGAGMLYVAPALIPACRPEFRGWFSQPDPFSWRLDQFSFAPDARRFDHGTPSPLPLVGSIPGLEWHAATGIAAVRRHNLALSHRLLAAAHEHRWTVLSPLADDARGGSVMLRVPSDPAAVLARLKAARFSADLRGPVLRLSPGWVTTAEAVDRLCELLRELL